LRWCVPWVRNPPAQSAALARRRSAAWQPRLSSSSFPTQLRHRPHPPIWQPQAPICCSRHCKAIRRRCRVFASRGKSGPPPRSHRRPTHSRRTGSARPRPTAARAAWAPQIPASIRSMSRAPNAKSPHHRPYSARSCRSRRKRHSRRCRPTTRPSLRHRLRSRSKCRRRRSIRCAPQCGSGQLCRRHRRRCRRNSSTIRRPRFIRSRPPIAPAAVWRRRGHNFTPTRSAATCRTMSPTRHRRTCNRPIPLRSGSGRNACCRSWPSLIRTRRSASAPARSYCFPRSTFRAPPAPIPNIYPAVRPPLMSSPRRN
jgi:hypothetical protein